MQLTVFPCSILMQQLGESKCSQSLRRTISCHQSAFAVCDTLRRDCERVLLKSCTGQPLKWMQHLESLVFIFTKTCVLTSLYTLTTFISKMLVCTDSAPRIATNTSNIRAHRAFIEQISDKVNILKVILNLPLDDGSIYWEINESNVPLSISMTYLWLISYFDPV